MSFTWIPLYSEIARKVLEFEHRQTELLGLLREFKARGLKVLPLQDQSEDRPAMPLAEIDPFTFFATFNRPNRTADRIAILGALREVWRLGEALPVDFDGVPTASFQNAWFFGFATKRKPSDVPTLWALARETVAATRASFRRELLGDAVEIFSCGIPKLTSGMFWLNPREYPPADQRSRAYTAKAGACLPSNPSVDEYFDWAEQVAKNVSADFPQMSFEAFAERRDGAEGEEMVELENGERTSDAAETKEPSATEIPQAAPFTKADALNGLFMPEAVFDSILSRLRRKKCIILQGPPGVGKTFVARRIAYAMMQERDDSRVKMVQFHPSYGYEDFIQGYRPDGLGLRLCPGVFFEFARRARNDAERSYFFIIDEINRGNLAKIFGELLMLLEADKRGPEHAVPLTYGSSDEEAFFLPANLYLIGTMNTADRSLAMVDYALRRRFAFVTLEPALDSAAFAAWLGERSATAAFIARLQARIGELNAVIKGERDLGAGFRIGHSFFCPANGCMPDEAWYREIIEGEIQPLLEEYFESRERVEKLVEELYRA